MTNTMRSSRYVVSVIAFAHNNLLLRVNELTSWYIYQIITNFKFPPWSARVEQAILRARESRCHIRSLQRWGWWKLRQWWWWWWRRRWQWLELFPERAHCHHQHGGVRSSIHETARVRFMETESAGGMEAQSQLYDRSIDHELESVAKWSETHIEERYRWQHWESSRWHHRQLYNCDRKHEHRATSAIGGAISNSS